MLSPVRLHGRIAVFGLAFTLTLCLPITLLADGLSFDQAQQQALQQSRQLAARDSAISAAREMAIVAGERPDPVLSFGIDNLPVSGANSFSLNRDFMTMRRVGVMQELTRADKRELRRERYEHETELADAEKAVTQTVILRATGKAWLERYYLQQMLVVVSEQLSQTRQQQLASAGAYRGGRGSQADVLAARSEVLLLEDQVADMQRRLRTANTSLTRWVGPAASTLALIQPPDITQIHFDISNLESHLMLHPELVLLARRIAAAESDAALANANRKADWSVEVSYAQRSGEFSNMMSIGVSAPLQWDQTRRQDRELAARQAQVEQARAERDEMFRDHVSEVRAMVDAWQTDLQRLNRYREGLLPLANLQSQAGLAAYRGGKSALTDVLMLRRSALAMQLQTLQLEMQTAVEWAELNFLLPTNTDSASTNPASTNLGSKESAT